MAGVITLLVLSVSYCSCMEMRETVEKIVMVRTTGSDLQPAATGYIYKKESDGPESVVTMGESEVMKELSKLYTKPEAYSAKIVAAPDKNYDNIKATSHVNEDIKPVVEKTEDDGHIDGIAHEDYGKILEDYAPHYDYKKDFADYLRRHYGHGPYHEQGGGKEYGAKGHHEYGDKDFKGFKILHHYGKGGEGDYHKGNYEGYGITGKGGYGKDYDKASNYGEHYAKGDGEKGGHHGHKGYGSKGETLEGYHKVYNKNEFNKDHDFYDTATRKGGFHKYNNEEYQHGSGAGGFEKGENHKSGLEKDGFGKGGYTKKESGVKEDDEHSAAKGGEISHDGHEEYGVKSGKHGGKGYGYEIKH